MTAQLNSTAPVRMTRRKPLASAPPVPGPVVGRLVRCEANTALVEFPGKPGNGPVQARTTVPLTPDSVGSEVVLLLENGDLAKPIIMGIIQNQLASSVTAELDGERMVLSAEREISLKCGEASITLTAAGKILIRGTYVLTRSSGANRIKGATVEIN